MSAAAIRNETSRRLAIVLVMLAVLSSLLIAAAVPAQAAAEPLKVVLVGNSYAAGNGARDENNNRNYEGPKGCYRSPTNWASQYVEWLGTEGLDVTFVNRACSGGVIANYTSRRFMDDNIVYRLDPADTLPSVVEANALANECRTRYPGDEVFVAEYGFYDDIFGHVVNCRRFLEPQINAVGKDTDLVLLTGGGNDVNFTDIIKQCFAPVLRDPGSCRDNVGSAQADIDIVRTRLVTVLGAIRDRSRTDTRVGMIGYPYLANNDSFELVSYSFGSILGGWETDRYAAAKEVRELGRQGDVAQAAAVVEANAIAGEDFVTWVSDLKDHFTGHEPKPEIGSGNPDRWISEIENKILIENYHYNAEGHRQLALLLREYGSFGAAGSPTGDASIDLAFVIDTTGSMGDDIEAVQDAANAIIDQLEAGTQSFRVAVVDYRDFADRTGLADDYPSNVVLDFSDDPTAIRGAIDGLTLGFGGDFEETMWSGLIEAFHLDWRPGVKKIVLQFGDAPALNPEPNTGYTTLDVIAESFLVDPVAVYAVDTGFAGDEIREVAAATGGEVLVAPSPAEVAAAIQEILVTAISAPQAWVGTTYFGYTGEAVAFSGAGSYDPDGEIVSWQWDVDGDGIYDASTAGPLFEHVYTSDYAGLVTLKVTDDSGLAALATAPVDVSIDGDGVRSDVDNCPDVHNPGQEDDDGDGVGDLCDEDFVLPTEDRPGVGFAVGPPPTAELIDAPYAGTPGAAIPIAGIVGDPEGDVVTSTWVTEGCTVADPLALATTVSCPAPGEYQLILVADDGNGGIVGAETIVMIAGSGGDLDGILAALLALRDAEVVQSKPWKEIDKVVDRVVDALDELSDVPPDVAKAIGDLKKAWDKLEKAVKDEYVDGEVGAGLLDAIFTISRTMAVGAIDAAVAGEGKPDKIEDAYEELAKGDEEAAKGDTKKAIDKYSKAADKAEKALD